MIGVAVFLVFSHGDADYTTDIRGDYATVQCASPWEGWQGHADGLNFNVTTTAGQLAHQQCESDRGSKTAGSIVLVALGILIAVGGVVVLRPQRVSSDVIRTSIGIGSPV
jgi:hypothetical protein